jgi:hypothetical protein
MFKKRVRDFSIRVSSKAFDIPNEELEEMKNEIRKIVNKHNCTISAFATEPEFDKYIKKESKLSKKVKKQVVSFKNDFWGFWQYRKKAEQK